VSSGVRNMLTSAWVGWWWIYKEIIRPCSKDGLAVAVWQWGKGVWWGVGSQWRGAGGVGGVGVAESVSESDESESEGVARSTSNE
jgi:hypothetical protein